MRVLRAGLLVQEAAWVPVYRNVRCPPRTKYTLSSTNSTKEGKSKNHESPALVSFPVLVLEYFDKCSLMGKKNDFNLSFKVCTGKKLRARSVSRCSACFLTLYSSQASA